MTRPHDLATASACLAALLPTLRERYAVRSLSVFGSYARGEQTPESDLDVMADFDSVPDLYDLVGLKLDIQDAVGMDVDLVMRDGVKPHVLPTILRDLVAV